MSTTPPYAVEPVRRKRELRIPGRVRDASASTRLVYVLLNLSPEPLSNADLCSMTGLSAETTRRALRELDRFELLIEANHPDDGRKCLYTLIGTETKPDDSPPQRRSAEAKTN